jgi:hypothetical protein
VGVIYPPIRQWDFAGGALRATLAGVRPAGSLCKESGAFWLGDRAAVARVTTVVLPSGDGVMESSGRWQVSAEVFGSISRWVTPRRLCLLGMAHTHMPGVPVRLSQTDRSHGVHVPGFLEIVIGNAGRDTDHRVWGWHVYEDGRYRRLLEPELSVRISLAFEIRIDVWRADAHGVYPGGTDEQPNVQ